MCMYYIPVAPMALIANSRMWIFYTADRVGRVKNLQLCLRKKAHFVTLTSVTDKARKSFSISMGR